MRGTGLDGHGVHKNYSQKDRKWNYDKDHSKANKQYAQKQALELKREIQRIAQVKADRAEANRIEAARLAEIARIAQAQKDAALAKQKEVDARAAAQERSSIYLDFKNIPGGDALGNTNPFTYPQHGFVIVRDNLTNNEWISRAGPGGEGGNAMFGSIKAITTRNVLGATLDSGAQVNYRRYASSDIPAQELVDRLKTFTNAVNQAQIPYNPLTRNSNSFALQAFEVVTGIRPPSHVWSPASQTVLEVN